MAIPVLRSWPDFHPRQGRSPGVFLPFPAAPISILHENARQIYKIILQKDKLNLPPPKKKYKSINQSNLKKKNWN